MPAMVSAQTVNIDGLPAPAAITGADLLECEQIGVNGKYTAGGIQSFVLNSAPQINLIGNINFGAGSGNAPANSSIWNVVSASGIATDPTQTYLNQFNITDNVDASASASGAIGWYFVDHLGTSAKKGRITGYFEQDVSSTPAAAGQSYTALEAFAHASVNIGTASVFGINVVSQIASTATAAQVVGNETDIRAQTGATYNDFIGQQNVILSTHGQAGALTNTGYTTTSQSASTPMFSVLYADGTRTGWPASGSGTTIFGCLPHALTGSCPSIANGFDLSKYASVTGNILTGPQNNGKIDGLFNITANAINLTGNINFGAGSSSGPPNSSIYDAISATGTCSDPTRCYINLWQTTETTPIVNSGSFARYHNWWNSQINTGALGLSGMFVNNMSASIGSGGSFSGTNTMQFTTLGVSVSANAGFGGGLGTEIGRVFALNPQVILTAFASHMTGGVVQENDFVANASATYLDTIFISNSLGSAHASAATRQSVSYETVAAGKITDNGGTVPALGTMLQEGDFNGFNAIGGAGYWGRCWVHGIANGIATAFSVSGTNNCGTIGYGFDFYSYYAVNNYLLRGPQGNGYIDGAFNFGTMSVVTPTLVAGLLTVSGIITTPTFNANGEGADWLSTTLGHVEGGEGSSNDWTVVNKNGTAVLQIPTGTGQLTLAGQLNLNGGAVGLSHVTSTNGSVSDALRNFNGGSSSTYILQIGNNTSATEVTMTLNGSANTAGNGANSFTISAASDFFISAGAGKLIQLGTGTEVVKMPSIGTGTPVASLCLDASNNIVKKTTTGACI